MSKGIVKYPDSTDDSNRTKDTIILSILYKDSCVLHHRIPLRYIIFGSETSIDDDILIWIHEDMTSYDSHIYVQWCTQLDSLLHHLFSKKVNSSMACWDTDGVLVWAQKGSELAETNNSIISTWNNHKQMEIYDSCPLKKMMPREPRIKVPGALRLINGKLSKSVMLRPYLDTFLSKMFQVQELYYPMVDVDMDFSRDFKTDERLYKEIFAGKSSNNTKRNNLCRKLCKQYYDYDKGCCVPDSDGSLNTISEILDLLEDSSVVFGQILRKVLKLRYIGLALDFLSNVVNSGFANIIIPDRLKGLSVNERLKTICFQLIQTSMLIDGVEVYDKAVMCRNYPCLEAFLLRRDTTPEDFENLERELLIFVRKIETNMDVLKLSRISTEITL